MRHSEKLERHHQLNTEVISAVYSRRSFAEVIQRRTIKRLVRGIKSLKNDSKEEMGNSEVLIRHFSD
jgi:hypothetical protein